MFESMEGNLYQLIKSRKGRPLAGGLVSSIFHQTVSGLYHIHASGYFHRDMKPENLLVTTTGLYDYRPVSPVAPPNAPPEKDVVVIIKLADFGLARETKSKPPYTEYVSTRWYRAPEVLLRSRDYSNPVDLWALGTIMAELVNLRPLFPGQGEIDQVARVCDLLGDPSDEYGLDSRGKSFGGGKWPRGIKMAKAVGFSFPKVSSSLFHRCCSAVLTYSQIQPKNIPALFDRSVPLKLVECIADLLKYDPDARLTARQCLDHPYLAETMPKNNPPIPVSSPPPLQSRSFPRASQQQSATLHTQSPRTVPPSHAHSPQVPKPSPHFDASSTHRTPFYPSSNNHRKDPDAAVANTNPPPDPPPNHTTNGYVNGGWDPMDVTSPEYDTAQPMDIQTSPVAQEYPNRPPPDPEPLQDPANPRPPDVQANGPKLKTLGSLVSLKWGLGKFGNGDKVHQQLPPVEENVASSNSTPSLKRSSSADSRSIEIPAPQEFDPKKLKKEAERMAKEAEKQKRALAEKMQREQARAVMQKRSALMQAAASNLEWKYAINPNPVGRLEAEKPTRNTTGPERRTHASHQERERSATTLNAAGGRYGEAPFSGWRGDERFSKARKRDWDDDHSMSSSDLGRMSVISFATVDSDPGPMRLRSRASGFDMHKSSTSSLRTAYEELTKSARSSNSLSYEQQLLNDFHLRPSVDAGSSLSDHGSPPPMQNLSIGSPQWSNQPQPMTSWSDGGGLSDRRQHLSPLTPPPLPPFAQGLPRSPSLSPYPSSPGLPKSAVNPMFNVVSLTTAELSFQT